MAFANALAKDSHFKRIERGQYPVGGGKAAPKVRAPARGKGRRPL